MISLTYPLPSRLYRLQVIPPLLAVVDHAIGVPLSCALSFLSANLILFLRHVVSITLKPAQSAVLHMHFLVMSVIALLGPSTEDECCNWKPQMCIIHISLMREAADSQHHLLGLRSLFCQSAAVISAPSSSLSCATFSASAACLLSAATVLSNWTIYSFNQYLITPRSQYLRLTFSLASLTSPKRTVHLSRSQIMCPTGFRRSFSNICFKFVQSPSGS